MDWDDELERMIDGADRAGSGLGLDPMNISDPASAYFLLSDDAQDEISVPDKKGMKCRSCGQRFTGEIYDRCPECFSSDTEEMPEEINEENW